MMVSAYSTQEIEAIAGWLREHLSATEIANKLAVERRCPVSRNAIIGIVHRNKRLAGIGFSGSSGRPLRGSPVPGAPSVPRAPKLNAGNIRSKKEGRALDPPFAPPKPRHVDDGIAPSVYDACARHLPMMALEAGECRWPVNTAAHAEQHLFCGKPALLSSYCPHHCRRAGSGYLAQQTHDVRSALKRSA